MWIVGRSCGGKHEIRLPRIASVEHCLRRCRGMPSRGTVLAEGDQRNQAMVALVVAGEHGDRGWTAERDAEIRGCRAGRFGDYADLWCARERRRVHCVFVAQVGRSI